ncbi:MAG: GNAT family N-acetyltransferase [Gammaproteobacteria bacterium]|nr:GNAT family N-acetyltransferase [Gammaproteobacteria bacterium]
MRRSEDVEIRVAQPQDRVPLQRLLEMYQHDISDIYDQDVDIHGEYGYPLDRYFTTPSCKAYVGFVSGHYAGFALADGSVKVKDAGHWMEQFFVLKKYRRSGFGVALAHFVFRALPGYWEVGQMAQNLPAQAFWRVAIHQFTNGKYVEYTAPNERWSGVVQTFTTTSGDA